VRVFRQARRPAQNVASPHDEDALRLRELGHRELDLISKLSLLYERHELYPGEVTDRQLAELNRMLDKVRAEIDALRAEPHGSAHTQPGRTH